MAENLIHCTIVTPEALALDVQAASVIIPAHDGLLGVQPGHAPLLCQLGRGILRYHDADNHEHRLYIEGGFGHVLKNELTLLTTQAIAPGQLSRADAESALKQAESLPMHTETEVAARTAALARAHFLLTLTESAS